MTINLAAEKQTGFKRWKDNELLIPVFNITNWFKSISTATPRGNIFAHCS